LTSNSRPSAVTPDTVVVHGDDIRVERAATELPLTEARARFGGLDVPAVLGGALAGLGCLVLLSGLLAAAGTVGYQQGLHDRNALSLAGLGGGLLVLLLTGLLGGWVAGRMARYDGARNGLLTAVLLVLVTAGLGALGAAAGSRVDIATRANLPTWVTGGANSLRALVTGLIALALVLLGGLLGGRLGARWHRRVDETVAGTRVGGLTPYPSGADR
jgi:hypothetical protein